MKMLWGWMVLTMSMQTRRKMRKLGLLLDNNHTGGGEDRGRSPTCEFGRGVQTCRFEGSAFVGGTKDVLG